MAASACSGGSPDIGEGSEPTVKESANKGIRQAKKGSLGGEKPHPEQEQRKIQIARL